MTLAVLALVLYVAIQAFALGLVVGGLIDSR